MGSRTGKEMRNLVLAVSLSVLGLVIAIIAYFMVDTILTTNRNIERNQELVVEESVKTLAQIGDDVASIATDPNLFSLLNQDVATSVLSGDWDAMYRFAVDFSLNFYPIDYIGVVKDGELVDYGFSRELKGDLEIDPSELPLEPPAEEYQKLDRMGNKEGYYLSKFFSIDLSMLGIDEFYVNMIVDRTDELAGVGEYFEGQRNNLVVRLSVAAAVAVVLSLLLTTLGLRYFTRKYVVKPIEELNRAAEEIAEGTFAGEVEVDEGSAYAALQGLLRSGHKVLRRMEEDMGKQ